MILGMILGAGIVIYIAVAVFFIFACLTAGDPLWALPVGIFWPILVPYWWIRSKIDQRRWRKEQERE